MSQERWDVVLRFVDGPLSFQGSVTCRGPVIRLGANPGPGGLGLDGYRGLDERHAVITCYDGGSVSIAPVGGNPVRVGPHEFQDWAELQPIRKPVYLSDGNAVHLGPIERGSTFVFQEAQRLGVWKEGQIISEAAQVNPDVLPSSVETLDTHKGVPRWFIPAVVVLFTITLSGVGLAAWLGWTFEPPPDPLGTTMEGKEYVTELDVSKPVQTYLLDGLNQPFHDFVMGPNAEVSGMPELREPENWDKKFFEYTIRSLKVHSSMRAVWKRMDAIHRDYSYVVRELRDAKLPEVFAGIPYQESRYRSDVTSFACAEGWWQFLPEPAIRSNIRVRDCSFKGTRTLWSPTKMVPPPNVMTNAEYIFNKSCKITSCAVDERQDLQVSTAGAIYLLNDAYRDQRLRESGAVVQATILSHNAGYYDEKIDGKRRPVNIGPSYERYTRKVNRHPAPNFYGDNILCDSSGANRKDTMGNGCGGVLVSHTQHYGYNIVAQHMLAVCYYGKNYSNDAAFAPYRKYLKKDGYCAKLIKVPTREEVARW
mgnify:CR=1 FL=1